jgi:hypothetical protein
MANILSGVHMGRINKKGFKIIILGLVSMLAFSCDSCETHTPKLNMPDSEAIRGVESLPIGKIDESKRYIDSLNELKDFNFMPHFLDDSCMDGNPLYWHDLHHPSSVRKFVIDNITNKNVLRYIVQNNLYKGKCGSNSPNSYIPYYNLSWNDLAKAKLDTLLQKY